MYVKFYVPSKDNKGQALADTERNLALESIARKFSAEFGGATLTAGQGYFLSASGQLIVENIQILASYTDTINDSLKDEIRALADSIKANLRQESIMLEFGDKAEFR